MPSAHRYTFSFSARRDLSDTTIIVGTKIHLALSVEYCTIIKFQNQSWGCGIWMLCVLPLRLLSRILDAILHHLPFFLCSTWWVHRSRAHNRSFYYSTTVVLLSLPSAALAFLLFATNGAHAAVRFPRRLRLYFFLFVREITAFHRKKN